MMAILPPTSPTTLIGGLALGRNPVKDTSMKKILIAKVLVQLYEHPTLYSIGWLSDSVSTPVKHGTSSLVFK